MIARYGMQDAYSGQQPSQPEYRAIGDSMPMVESQPDYGLCPKGFADWAILAAIPIITAIAFIVAYFADKGGF